MLATTAIVGALACQKNSFLKTLQTKVVACKDYQPILTSRDKQNLNKKSANANKEPSEKLYAVELEDTVLFPEGGGQPFDTGRFTLPDNRTVPVKMVLRKELTAVHVTEEPVPEGSSVLVEVDWERRMDIMQQHTGQHLISAVFDTYGLETLSWAMGDTISYIELPQKISDEMLQEAATKINSLILEDLPIKVTVPDNAGGELDISHLPDDYDVSKGIIRVVTISGLDTNPCCGTHLNSTGQIQSVALLHQTNIRGGNSRLHFACGSRVPQIMAQYHNLLKDVSGAQLSCQIEEIGQKVADLNANYRASKSRESSLMKELAGLKAAEVFERFNNGKKIAHFYRPENNSEFMTIFLKELTTLINSQSESKVNLKDDSTIVLLSGDKSSAGGMVKVMGPQASGILAVFKDLLSNMKGGGGGASFQGKVTKYEKGEVESVLRYLESLEI